MTCAVLVSSGGCYLPSPPSLTIGPGEVSSVSADGVVMTFTLEATNDTDRELPLMGVRYRAWLTGVAGRTELFEAERSAQASVPREGTSRIRLPVPIPASALAVTGDGQRTIDGEVEIEGSIRYRKGGRLYRTLSDLGLSRRSWFRWP